MFENAVNFRIENTRISISASDLLATDGAICGNVFRLQMSERLVRGGDATLCQIGLTTCYYFAGVYILWRSHRWARAPPTLTKAGLGDFHTIEEFLAPATNPTALSLSDYIKLVGATNSNF